MGIVAKAPYTPLETSGPLQTPGERHESCRAPHRNRGCGSVLAAAEPAAGGDATVTRWNASPLDRLPNRIDSATGPCPHGDVDSATGPTLARPPATAAHVHRASAADPTL